MENFIRKLGAEGRFGPLFRPEFWDHTTVLDFSRPEFTKGKWLDPMPSEEKEEIERMFRGEAPARTPRGKPGGASAHIWRTMEAANAKIGIGVREVKPGIVQQSEHYKKRVLHIALDFYADEGTDVLAPLDGRVFLRGYYGHGDYGHGIALEHTVDGKRFFTFYGHMSKASVERLKEGQLIRRGEPVGQIGNREEGGGWQPHVHFQIVTKKKDLNIGKQLPWGYVSPKRVLNPLLRLWFRYGNRFPNPAFLWPDAPWFGEVEKLNQWKDRARLREVLAGWREIARKNKGPEN